MTAVALLEMSIRPDAEGVDDILRADLPHTGQTGMRTGCSPSNAPIS